MASHGLSEEERFRLAYHALSSPKIHGLAADAAIEVIETHGAVVFLAGEKAWKIKKPHDFGYMDFSSIEKRYWALNREAKINLAWAPDVYGNVNALIRDDAGNIGLGGHGETIDYALEMRRFDPSQVLASIADAGQLTAEHAEGAARACARGASKAPRVLDRDPVEAVAMVINSNQDCLRRHPQHFAKSAIDDLTSKSREALALIAALLKRRGENGLVRHCHADMHLGNIVLIKGNPTPFDGIEFSDAFAEIDVGYDAAFLFMDLWRRGLRVEASRALSAWVDEMARENADFAFEGLCALPLFLSLRAAVRAHCAADSNDFALAEFFLAQANEMLAGSEPRLVAIGGLSGSGKSTLARLLAPHLASAPGALVLRSDEIRKRLAGVNSTDGLGPEFYTPEASAQVHVTRCREAMLALRAGRGVIVDSVFGAPAEQVEIERVAREAEVPFSGLWLDAPLETRVQRVENRVNDASDANVDIVRGQIVGLTRHSWTKVDASGSPQQILTAARNALGI